MSSIIHGITEAASTEVTELLRYIMANSNRAFDYYEQLEDLFDSEKVTAIELDQILLNNDLRTGKIKAFDVIMPVINSLLATIKPEGRQHLPLLKKLSYEWAKTVSPYIDKYIERNLPMFENKNDDRLSSLESAVSMAKNITKDISYDDTAKDILARIQVLANTYNIDKSKLDMAVDEVIEANNNLIFKVYDLVTVFEDELKDEKWRIEDGDLGEGQIYSTGGGAGQSYRKFVPKTDSSNESLIMKGIQREGKKGSKGKQQFDEITQQILDMIWQSGSNDLLRYLVFNPDVGIELDTNNLDDALEFAEEFAYNNPDSPTLVFDRQTNFPITSFNTVHEGYSAGAAGGAGLGENKNISPKKTVYIIYIKNEPVVKMADYTAVKELYDFMKNKNPNLDMKMVKKQSDVYESTTKNNYKKLVEFLDMGGGDDNDDDDLRQQVIEMYFEDGLKEAEIAEIVGITELKVNQIIDDYERGLNETWSKKYKKSIDCSKPKGFSQKAHCAGRKARQSGKKTKSKSVNK